MNSMPFNISISNKDIGENNPSYFIADIAANHDGSLSKAKELIHMAAESGADAAKFQHFQAKSIVSDYGFKSLDQKLSHQSTWKKSVYQVYDEASVNWEWTEELCEECKNAGIPFFTTPYSLDVIDYIDDFVPAYKIGSGDITWHDLMVKVASRQKPYMLATGASTLQEVINAVDLVVPINNKFVLMQCNTNYTGSIDNFKYINLNVLKTYKLLFPDLILGLSDHTPGHSTVLGAVALGARVIEKHFTDDNNREGPDHAFSMSPVSWREMVDRTRELEYALGSSIKAIAENETDTVILQRRSMRLNHDLKAGDQLLSSNVSPLRPCTPNSLQPFEINKFYGRQLRVNKSSGDALYPYDFADD